MALDQSAGVAGIGLQVQQARGVGVQHRIGFDLFVGRQADDGLGAVVARTSTALESASSLPDFLQGLMLGGDA